MILLLGGTSDTAPLARQLAERGHRVLVSKATTVPLEIGDHPRIELREGPLDERGLMELIAARRIRAVIDAAHPYAAALHEHAQRAAAAAGVICLRLTRPSGVEIADDPLLAYADDHPQAAALAFADGRPVLATIGSKNLAPYAAQSQRTGVPLVVRVLDHPDSLEACRRLGIAASRVLSGRGPFTVEVNRQQLRDFAIGVLVTKDSGPSGGTPEKLAAARAEGCRVIVVRRPEAREDQTFVSIAPLLERLEMLLG